MVFSYFCTYCLVEKINKQYLIYYVGYNDKPRIIANEIR